MPKPPDCERCGLPAHNVNGRGDHTGIHMNERECFGAAILQMKRYVTEDAAAERASRETAWEATRRALESEGKAWRIQAERNRTALRDMFAADALTVGIHRNRIVSPDPRVDAAQIARLAYAIADAMIEERERAGAVSSPPALEPIRQTMPPQERPAPTCGKCGAPLDPRDDLIGSDTQGREIRICPKCAGLPERPARPAPTSVPSSGVPRNDGDK